MQPTNYLTLHSSRLATLQTSTLSLSTLTGSTIRASFLTLSTLTVSSINGALPGTGTGAFSTLAVSSLQTASTIITSSINVTTGNVGIGTAAPAGRLTSYTTSADHTAPPDANPTNHQFIVANSKVGTTPYAMALGIDQTLGVGYINAAGNTSVQPVCLNTRGGNVGIGIATPTALLHIKTTSAAMRITGNLTNTSTRPALSTTPGAYEIRGSGSGGDTPDDGFLRLSAGGGTATSVQSYIDLSGYSQTADMNSNIIFGASGAERMRVTSTGLNVVGAIYASGDITAFSDQRYKQNIIRLDRSLDKICSLGGYSYTREDYRAGERQIGLLAQEVKAVLPEAVHYDSINDIYSVNYNCLMAPVIEAIKELSDRVEAQQAALRDQQSVIKKLLDRLGPE
jgi:hypothetical protein